MNVQELIELLSKMPGDAQVWVLEDKGKSYATPNVVRVGTKHMGKLTYSDVHIEAKL